MTKGIRDFLTEHESKSPVSFHMPGHKGYEFFARNGFGDAVKRLASWDITEICGADNLFQPESIIRRTMDKYQRLYDVKKSYLLINGSSAGIIAAILAAVPRGGKLIMARNCHKSVFNALRLGDIEPVYAFPKTEEDYSISGEITAEEIEKCMDENPDARVVIITSPNYYGVCSDIENISRKIHERGGLLIVDQAHGAHLKFFSIEEKCAGNRGEAEGSASGNTELIPPRAAEELGADAVINSTHKTLASFTQTAVLNICSDRIDLNAVEDRLQMMESSSPSYPLMATLDINADILASHAGRLMKDWLENIRWFYHKAAEIEGLVLMKTARLDYTKLNIDMSRFGFDGAELEKFLMSHGVFPELVSGNMVMCMSGIGNTRRDYERLIEALSEAAERGRPDRIDRLDRSALVETTGLTGWSVLAETAGLIDRNGQAAHSRAEQKVPLPLGLARTEIPQERESVHITQAAGRVCVAAIIPYPPGIPLICPGEIFTQEIVDYVKAQREAGEKVIGVDEELRVSVGKK